MIRILTTLGPEGLTEIQWIERYHYEELRDLLRRLETLLRVCPVMRRIGKDKDGKAFVMETINAQLDLMELERIRVALRKGLEVTAYGYEKSPRQKEEDGEAGPPYYWTNGPKHEPFVELPIPEPDHK